MRGSGPLSQDFRAVLAITAFQTATSTLKSAQSGRGAAW